MGSGSAERRTLLVRSDSTLEDLHFDLQSAFDWDNDHLHQFIVDGAFYASSRMVDLDPYEEKDKADFKISDVLDKVGDKMIYEYDFGDSWRHVVLLQKILEPEPDGLYPIAIKGKRRAPIEDSGGIWRYEYMVDVLADPEHEHYEELRDWHEGPFDPDEFALEAINEWFRPLR